MVSASPATTRLAPSGTEGGRTPGLHRQRRAAIEIIETLGSRFWDGRLDVGGWVPEAA
jgi:hypothetical protein